MTQDTILYGLLFILALVPLANVIIAAVNLWRSKNKDTKGDSAQTTTLLVEIGAIKSGVDDIKAEQKAQAKTNIEVLQRLTAVEESAKQAHKRIDRIQEGRDHQDGGYGG